MHDYKKSIVIMMPALYLRRRGINHISGITKSLLRQNALRRSCCARKLMNSRREPTPKNFRKFGSQIKRGTSADHRHCLALRSWSTLQRLQKLLFQK